jgi:hypothetical protein
LELLLCCIIDIIGRESALSHIIAPVKSHCWLITSRTNGWWLFLFPPKPLESCSFIGDKEARQKLLGGPGTGVKEFPNIRQLVRLWLSGLCLWLLQRPGPKLHSEQKTWHPVSKFLNTISLSLSFSLNLGRTGIWTQGLALAWQVLYHLRHIASPFCSGSFWGRVSLFAWANLDHDTPVYGFQITRMTGVGPSAQSFLLRWDGFLQTFLYRLALNFKPPDLSLLCSKDYRCEPQAPSFFPPTLPPTPLCWWLNSRLPTC